MENMTNEEIMAGGVVGGMSIAIVSMIALVWILFQIIAMWKIFNKAGVPGWHSIIPILNIYDLFNICWKGVYGLLFMIFSVISSLASSYYQKDPSTMLMAVMAISAIIVVVLGVISMHKLSKSFGHGIGFTIGLVLLEPIFLLVLGFGSSRYIGKEDM